MAVIKALGQMFEYRISSLSDHARDFISAIWKEIAIAGLSKV